MSQASLLPIQPRHVIQQFNRRAPLDSSQFIYGEIAQRMLSRLSYIRLDAKHVLDAGCGAGHALDPLRSRYPDMDYIGIDASPALLAVANERHAKQASLWDRLRNHSRKPVRFIEADLATPVLPAESINLLWSNMALHWHPEPEAVFSEWRRVLAPEGLAMFSTLGPGSFAELRAALHSVDPDDHTLQFVDMHDYGDQMLHNGFTDPVMDQEVITLTYQSAEKLLNEVHALGGNAHTARRAGLRGRGWRQRLIAALESQRHMDGTIHLTLEVAYGHAWRATTRKDAATGEVHIPISSIGRRKSS